MPDLDPLKSAGVKLAAGGLVWRREAGQDRLAVIRRTRHHDWVLPKGKPEAGESLAEAALREAQEETGMRLQREGFAGSYHYLVDGVPKVVLVWQFRALAEDYPAPAGRDEIAERVWLSPVRAMERLSHAAERAFLAEHHGSAGAALPVFEPCPAPREKLDRLRAAWHSVNDACQAVGARHPAAAQSWWATAARRSLQTARAAWQAGQLDAGWGAVHDAERFLVFGLEDAGLLTRAASVRSEAVAKLKGWRAAAVAALFAGVPLEAWRKAGKLPTDARPALEAATVEALRLLHEHSDNVYHRMRLVERQMHWMVLWCLGLLAAVLGAANLVDQGSLFHFDALLPVLLAGGFGGVLSALFQLSRVGEQKIPEALLHGLITSGRPVIGMVSALFVYVVLQAGILNLPANETLTRALTLAFAFAAGFSDRLVLRSVGTLTGGSGADSGTRPGHAA